MKLLSIEFGQVTWIVDLKMPSGTLYLPDTLMKINERYGFIKGSGIDELLSQQASPTFEHGKFDGTVIRKFSVHTDGLVAESQAGTDAAEHFLDDVVNWSKEVFYAEILEISEPYRIYDSHLVVQMSTGVNPIIETLGNITSEIEKRLSTYGLDGGGYEFSGFSLSRENVPGRGLATSAFQIERRIGKPFRNNIYFSTAPLRLGDHIGLLESIENRFKSS